MEPEVCPHCGHPVPPRARACRECGSDAETGWLPYEEIAYARVELPEGEPFAAARFEGEDAADEEEAGYWTEHGWVSAAYSERAHWRRAVAISILGVIGVFFGLLALAALAQFAPWALGSLALAALLLGWAKRRASGGTVARRRDRHQG